MIDQIEAPCFLILRELVDVVKVYCRSLVATIDYHEVIIFLALHELDCNRMVPNLSESHSWVLLCHASCGVVFHDLILHQGQLLCHLH